MTFGRDRNAEGSRLQAPAHKTRRAVVAVLPAVPLPSWVTTQPVAQCHQMLGFSTVKTKWETACDRPPHEPGSRWCSPTHTFSPPSGCSWSTGQDSGAQAPRLAGPRQHSIHTALWSPGRAQGWRHPCRWTEGAFCPRDQTGRFPGDWATMVLLKPLAATIDGSRPGLWPRL